MTQATEVEFIGGPLDGHKRSVELQANGAPELRLTIETMGVRLADSNTYPVVQERYLRRLNARDEGGLWEYVWVAPPPGGWK